MLNEILDGQVMFLKKITSFFLYNLSPVRSLALKYRISGTFTQYYDGSVMWSV